MAARVVDAQMPENAYTYQEIETNPNFLAYESDLNEIAYIDAKREKMVLHFVFHSSLRAGPIDFFGHCLTSFISVPFLPS